MYNVNRMAGVIVTVAGTDTEVFRGGTDSYVVYKVGATTVAAQVKDLDNSQLLVALANRVALA